MTVKYDKYMLENKLVIPEGKTTTGISIIATTDSEMALLWISSLPGIGWKCLEASAAAGNIEFILWVCFRSLFLKCLTMVHSKNTFIWQLMIHT